MISARFICTALTLFLLLLIAYINSDAETESKSLVAGRSQREAMKLGEAMYRKGVLPSGGIMIATVQGDIPVEGTMITCQNCHLRSGLGSLEGKVITFPTNGRILFSPLPAGVLNPSAEFERTGLHRADRRPAYNDETLARAIRNGIDPNGRKLNPAMPRYALEDSDLSILIYYLKNLSTEYSPGVTDTTLRFATIVAEGVTTEDREAMLAPLNAYIRARNSNPRNFRVRAKTMFAEEMDLSYRELLLELWELKGPPESWRSQLEAFYKKEPVFAILGGIAPGDWTPIHRFCEENEIPCILPVTDFPVLSETDWYTLYVSKSFFKEGEAAAIYLARTMELPHDVPVVQIFRNNSEGAALAKSFREARISLGENPPGERILNDNDVVDEMFWKELAMKYRDAVAVLWLNRADLSGIQTLAKATQRPRILIVSGGLLKERFDDLPDDLRDTTFITYPWSMPDEVQQRLKAFESWMKVRKISVTNCRVSSQMYLLGQLMSEAFMHMGRHFYRDYFLDVIDMMPDQTNEVVSYPRLSFGQGQRYLSKGSYVVQLSRGTPARILKKSGWVIH